MGFKLKVEGPSTIDLGTTIVTGVKFRTDIPHDSNARSTDMGSTVEITGKILTAVDGDPFDSWVFGRLSRQRSLTVTARSALKSLRRLRWYVSIHIQMLSWLTTKKIMETRKVWEPLR